MIAVTSQLPRTYQATATLFVAGPKAGQETVLDTTQGEQLARTYTALASTPAVADSVLAELDLELTRDELLARMAFAPVERTQLLNITAEADSAEEAATVANVYADVFVDRSVILSESERAPSRVAVSEQAVPPEEPSSPNVPLLIGFGAILSLLAGFAAALLRDRFDRRLPVGDEDEALCELPILTRTPQTDGFKTVLDPADGWQLIDSLRVLRTGLELADGRPAKTLLITSPSEGDGKSTLAATLAVNMARDGATVTLLECDVRRPTLDLSAVAPGFSPDGPGLVAFLEGTGPADRVKRSDVTLPGLQVIYAGSHGIDPGPLLRSRELEYLIAARKLAGDWVILDSPPVSIGDDALLLTRHVDGVVLVVDAKSTTLPALRSGIAQLRRIGARVMGVVVNRAAVESSSPYYLTEGARRSLGVSGSTPDPERQADPSPT